MKIKREIFILALIVIFGAFLRLYHFGLIPQGFQIDEAAFGYNAYSIMKTGRDEYGKYLPLTLRSYDDYKAAFYSYIDIPFVAIFGLSETSVRLPTAVLGIFFIVLAYLFTFEITKKVDLSLVVSGLCSISQTLIFQNRIQSDPFLGTFLVVLGVYLFIIWLRIKNNNVLLIASFFSFFLSTISYQFPRVFLLLFLPSLFFFYRKPLGSKNILPMVFLTTLLFLSSLQFLILGKARASQTSVFTVPDVRLMMEEAIREGRDQSPILTHIFQNKPIYYSRAIVQNYFSYLSFDFLFFQATSPVRESVQNTGFLYLIEFPFLIFGIYQMIRNKINWGILMLVWVLTVPLALSPFIYESPNIHRNLLSILPLEIITGFGIIRFLEYFKKTKFLKIMVFVLFITFISELFYFLDEFFIYQPIHKPYERDYPYNQLFPELKKIEGNYKNVVISTSGANIYMYYLFYKKYDPKTYQNSGSHGNEEYNSIGKYIFVHLACATNDAKDNSRDDVLFVDDSTCGQSSDYTTINTINWGNGLPALYIKRRNP